MNIKKGHTMPPAGSSGVTGSRLQQQQQNKNQKGVAESKFFSVSIVMSLSKILKQNNRFEYTQQELFAYNL